MQIDLHVTPKGQDGHQKRETLLEEVEETTFREDEDWGGNTPIFWRNKIMWIYRLKKHPIVIPKWSLYRVLLLNSLQVYKLSNILINYGLICLWFIPLLN